jgi:hypothetical protein
MYSRALAPPAHVLEEHQWLWQVASPKGCHRRCLCTTPLSAACIAIAMRSPCAASCPHLHPCDQHLQAEVTGPSCHLHTCTWTAYFTPQLPPAVLTCTPVTSTCRLRWPSPSATIMLSGLGDTTLGHDMRTVLASTSTTLQQQQQHSQHEVVSSRRAQGPTSYYPEGTRPYAYCAVCARCSMLCKPDNGGN